MNYKLKNTVRKYKTHRKWFDNCQDFLNNISTKYVKNKRTLFRKILHLLLAECVHERSTVNASSEDDKKYIGHIFN